MSGSLFTGYKVRHCSLKKVELRKLTEIDVYKTVVEMPVLKDIKGTPQAGWNVVSWNKMMPEHAICFGYPSEKEAITAYNTICKMTSTLAACLREKVNVRSSYVWML